MIRQGIVREQLSIDSHVQRKNGSCPLMPEEVNIIFIFIVVVMVFLNQLE